MLSHLQTHVFVFGGRRPFPKATGSNGRVRQGKQNKINAESRAENSFQFDCFLFLFGGNIVIYDKKLSDMMCSAEIIPGATHL